MNDLHINIEMQPTGSEPDAPQKPALAFIDSARSDAPRTKIELIQDEDHPGELYRTKGAVSGEIFYILSFPPNIPRTEQSVRAAIGWLVGNKFLNLEGDTATTITSEQWEAFLAENPPK